MNVNYLDLFSGVGGFSLGLNHAGFKFDWHGYSEIDTYAESIYQKQFPEAIKLGDITNVNTKALPKIELITLGWPCQDVSIAGRRGGLQAARSGLFFEAIKILRSVRPNYFIAENVKGLFSSNNGADFTIVLQEIANIGYDCQWQLLNTRWVLPQNRERIYFVGYLRERPRPEIFPLTESDLWTPRAQEAARRTGTRIRSENSKDIASSILKRYGGDGCDTVVGVGDACDGYGASGKIQDQEGDCSTLLKAMGTGGNNIPLIIPENTKKGYVEAEEGDSINYEFSDSDTRRGRVGKGVAHTVDRNVQQGVVSNNSVRRLTPMECERLQGFPDGWTEGLSDTRRYQALGNAVSVPIVTAIAKKLKGETDEKICII